MILGGLIYLELIAVLFSLPCFWHAKKHYGKWMAWCFIIGSFVFTGLQESIWILFGRFTGLAGTVGLGETVHGTYWFPKALLRFVEIPVYGCLSWFYVAYSSVWIATKACRSGNVITVAAIGSLIAMLVDIWVYPVQTAPENMMWVWAQQDVIRIYGIPISNFTGWFLMIFFFALVLENLPRWESSWGRAKATKVFFLTLLVGDVGMTAVNSVVDWVIRGVVVASGFTSTLNIPVGW